MKIFRLFTLFVLAMLSLLLAGCAANTPAPIATAIVEATETSAPLPTATEVTIPTETAAPTAAPTEVLATSTPNATQQAMAAALALVEPCNVANPNFDYSPSKNWAVVTCMSENQGGLITKLARLDGTKAWDISFNDFYIQPYRANDVNMEKLLTQAFIPVYWTLREDYVYLAVPNAEENTPYTSYAALFRLDTASGKLTPTLGPVNAPQKVAYAFRFSPGTKLAHINQMVQTVQVVIDDTLTGDEETITLDPRFIMAGSLAWPKDDEKQLAISAFDANTTGGGYSLIVYNFETKTNEYVIQQSAEAYLPIEWLDAETIYASKGEQWFYINTVTKAISEAPAPVPTP